jgi:hypothetical protein
MNILVRGEGHIILLTHSGSEFKELLGGHLQGPSLGSEGPPQSAERLSRLY